MEIFFNILFSATTALLIVFTLETLFGLGKEKDYFKYPYLSLRGSRFEDWVISTIKIEIYRHQDSQDPYVLKHKIDDLAKKLGYEWVSEQTRSGYVSINPPTPSKKKKK